MTIEQGVHFHLNHPIRFVYLCGTVVGINPIVVSTRDQSRILLYVIFEIDDASGNTIEVKITALKEGQRTKAPEDRSVDVVDEDESRVALRDGKQASNLGHISAPKTVDTDIDNVKVVNRCAVDGCAEWHVTVAGEMVDLYTVLKAKGQVTRYNEAKQLQLQRVFIVRTTDEEMRVWQEYSGFVSDVLARPWTLDKKQLRHLEKTYGRETRKAEAKREKNKAYEREKEERAERRREKARLIEESEEKKRQAQKDDLDGNPLDRPRWKPWSDTSRESKVKGTKRG